MWQIWWAGWQCWITTLIACWCLGCIRAEFELDIVHEIDDVPIIHCDFLMFGVPEG